MSFQVRLDGLFDPEGKYPNPLTGQPYSKHYTNFSLNYKPDGKPDGWIKFRTWQDRKLILKKIHTSNILLAKLPPGTGKTVILPKILLHYFGYERLVICTGPKQTTVQGAGEYAAKLMDVPLYWLDDKGEPMVNPNASPKAKNKYYPTGYKIVGYKHGASTSDFYDKTTKLLFTTDGSVKQRILQGNDPNLTRVGGVVIDEAHERSVNIDVVIALLCDIIKRRPDFKVIITSATLDIDLFKTYFKKIGLENAYSVYDLPDVPPPAKRYYEPELKRIDPSKFIDIIYNRITEIILNPKYPVGDILAFVTSDSETQKLRNKIRNDLNKFPVNNKPYAIAFSATSLEPEPTIAKTKNALQTMVKPDPVNAPQGYNRKVIIGTNAVESSVTFGDNLVHVIDSGLAYERRYDAENYCYKIGKFYVSQASIEQRCGRTGRTCDGTCYQLYTTPEFSKFDKFTAPKILVEDITKDLLGIICMPMNGNLQKGLEFLDRMVQDTKTYKHSIKRAVENLMDMNLIDEAGNMTLLGRICNSVTKYDLKIAKMIVAGHYLGCLQHCVILGAILTKVMSIEDLFVKPLYMDEDKQLEKEFTDNIKRLKYDGGDHLTLLVLYLKWLSNPNPDKFADDNKLDKRLLEKKIKPEYEALLEEITNILPDIQNANLFQLPSDAIYTGGGSHSESSLTGDDSSDDEMLTETQLENMFNQMGGLRDKNNKTLSSARITNHNIETFLAEAHNYEQRTTNSTTDNTGSHHETNAFDGQENRGNYDLSSNITYQTGGNARGNRINTTRQYTNKNIQTKFTHNRQTLKNTHTNSNTAIEQHILKGGKADKADKAAAKEKEKDLEKKAKRNQKIIDVITFRNYKNTKLNIPKTLMDRIKAAIFYGFATNIASWTGSGKKYYVRNSPVKGSTSKSVYDFSDKIPTFVTYYEFTVTSGISKSEDTKLNMVCDLKPEDIAVFFDLNDIRKKI